VDLKDINLNVINNFFNHDTFQLAKEICDDVGVLNSYEIFSGKRCDLKNRYFITKKSPPHYRELANYVLDEYHYDGILRMEVANDTDGFWLKPHNDHPERIQSIVVYVNGYGPGTTFYFKEEKLTIPWENNKAIQFKTNGLKTYDLSQISHGVEREKIVDIRSSIIISFVKNWNNLETCYYD